MRDGPRRVARRAASTSRDRDVIGFLAAARSRARGATGESGREHRPEGAPGDPLAPRLLRLPQSFLDLDEWLFDLADMVDVVYSPLMDTNDYLDDVDIVLVEGAVANRDNLELAERLRANSRLVVAFGDCAVTGTSTALRNPRGEPAAMLQRVYVDASDRHGVVPVAAGIVPELLPQVQALHGVIAVDAHMPGCPPSPERIKAALTGLLDGDPDHRWGIRFG